MKICSLGSGSKGNALFIESENAQVLIDCGFSFADLLLRFNAVGGDVEKLKGVVITHEHIDHIRALKNLVKDHNIKVFVHEDLKEALEIKMNMKLNNVYIFKGEFFIEDILFKPIEVSHDSHKCYGYTFSVGYDSASLLTDLGEVTKDIYDSIKGSKLVYLESNYEESMLRANIKYPPVLKRRILSKSGHLSNRIASQVVARLAMDGVSQVVLVHLSEDNNDPRVVYNAMIDELAKVGIVEGEGFYVDISGQYRPGNIFKIK